VAGQPFEIGAEQGVKRIGKAQARAIINTASA